MEKPSEDEELDFLSPKFDPLKVLTTSPSKIELPCPDVQPCDNLQMYNAVLQGKRKVYEGPKVGTDTFSKKDEQVGVVLQSQTKYHEPRYYSKSVVEYMKRPDLGPFQLLQTCLLSGATVRVWIRHCVGVRGVCEGVILAFDKHMNVVIGNVTEYYSPFRTLGNGGLESSNKKKKKKKKKRIQDSVTIKEGSLQTSIDRTTGNSHVTTDCSHVTSKTIPVMKGCFGLVQEKDLTVYQSRFVKKLFIRGDNVVLISPTHHTTSQQETKQ